MIRGQAQASTDGERVDELAGQLRAAGAAEVLREAASRGRSDRAQVRRVLAEFEPGDVLLVTRLDRVAGFRSLGDPWAGTTTPDSGSMMAVLGRLAEFERAIMRVRAGEGRGWAKARGVLMGRRPKLTPV